MEIRSNEGRDVEFPFSRGVRCAASGAVVNGGPCRLLAAVLLAADLTEC